MTGFKVEDYFNGMGNEEVKQHLLAISDKDRLTHEVHSLQEAISHCVKYWGDTKRGASYMYGLWNDAKDGILTTNLFIGSKNRS